MAPRSSRPLVAALKRLSEEGVRAKLFTEGRYRLHLRVEAVVPGPASTARSEEVRRVVRRAVLNPEMPVAVLFDRVRP